MKNLAALLLVLVAALVVGGLTTGCGDDARAPVACNDPTRVPPPPDTVPYSSACCASVDCAQLGTSKGVCADFGDEGRLCTHACTSDADCKGLGPETCTSGKVCESSAAEPPTTDG